MDLAIGHDRKPGDWAEEKDGRYVHEREVETDMNHALEGKQH